MATLTASDPLLEPIVPTQQREARPGGGSKERTTERRLDNPKETATEPEAPATEPAEASASKPSRAKKVLPVLALLSAAVVGGLMIAGQGKESTDDAQVEAHVANVAARVPGQVKEVLVKDNQVVKPGDVLVRLDDRDALAKLAAVRADVAAAEASLQAAVTQLALTEKSVDGNLAMARGGLVQAGAAIGSSRAQIDQAKADGVAADSRLGLARAELERSQKLLSDGAVSKAEFDVRKSRFDEAEAQVSLAKARIVSAEANLANGTGTAESARGRMISAKSGPEQVAAAQAQVALAKARVDQAKAALEQAELAKSYTEVRSTVSGTVARRTVEVGQLVSPERPLLAVVDLDDTWIVANFKEDQLKHMSVGQPVTIKIDTFGSRTFSGKVDSFSPGTGSRFSLLPPDNASGNFTKVVQRVPVLVRLEGAKDVVLRPGMSADVVVLTK